MNQNRRSKMGLTSHIYCLSNTFSSYHDYFSLMKIMTAVVLGPGHLVRSHFRFSLKIMLVVAVEYVVPVRFYRAHGVKQFVRIAYAINQLPAITYEVNLFLGIRVCRIAYF